MNFGIVLYDAIDLKHFAQILVLSLLIYTNFLQSFYFRNKIIRWLKAWNFGKL